jgi:hypothetical protein
MLGLMWSTQPVALKGAAGFVFWGERKREEEKDNAKAQRARRGRRDGGGAEKDCERLRGRAGRLGRSMLRPYMSKV